MTSAPPEDEVSRWHRRFAVDANNRAWALCEKPDLTPLEATELLYAAYAAAHHWSKVGTAEHAARAEMLLGHAHALLGHAGLAMRFATAAFDAIAARESAPWERAFAHAVLANAAASAGDWPLYREHYTKARQVGESLHDPEERDIFRATFDRIPRRDV